MHVMARPSRKKSWQTGRERVSVLADLAIRKETVVRKLMELREAHDLTQERAAAKVGVTVRQWQRWESGVSVPYARNLSAIAGSFKIDESEFFDSEPPRPVKPSSGDDSQDRLARIEEAVQGTYQLLQNASDARHAQQEEILQRIEALEQAMIRNGSVVADRAVDQVRDLVTQPDEVVQAIDRLAAELHADADRQEAENAATRQAGEPSRRAAPRRSVRAAK